MQTFPLSDSILLPLTATIAGEITKYLELTIPEFLPHALGDLAHRQIVELSNNRPEHYQLNIPLRRVPTTGYQYVSAIAHRLAAKLALSPLEICQRLQLELQYPSVRILPGLEMSCWYNEAGYIYFQLQPQAIALWLNYIQHWQLDRDPEPDRDFQVSSIVLYAHARCCSYLSLARTQQLISINDRWQISTPLYQDRLGDRQNQINAGPDRWLSAATSPHQNRPTGELMLIFEEPVEDRLIHTLIDILDAICKVNRGEHPSKFSVHHLALDLAQSWLEFYRYCRIFDATQRQNPRLAIARCGLTAISRQYLQVLLENYLGVTAPTEL